MYTVFLCTVDFTCTRTCNIVAPRLNLSVHKNKRILALLGRDFQLSGLLLLYCKYCIVLCWLSHHRTCSH